MLAAVQNGDVKKLAELIRQDPGFDVNMSQDGFRRTLLHFACLAGDNRSHMIPLLLAHPDIDVNLKDMGGYTPFCLACYAGCTSCVRELLKDSRVKVNEPRTDGYPPLWWAAWHGHLDIIKWWIVSGREMDFGKPGDIYKTDAIGGAKKEGKKEVVNLLEIFQSDSTQTRHSVRVELGLLDEVADEVFALMVFVSDGLLQIRDTASSSPAARFFNIARRLPLELQMVLCHRVVGSVKEIIPGKESEVAFKSLAKSLLWASFFTD